MMSVERKEILRLRAAEWKKANPGKVKEMGRRYRREQPERIKASYRHWIKHNPERVLFYNMIARCRNPNHISYASYGGRGIDMKYQSFGQFIADVGPRPNSSYSIDRINNNDDYRLGNCKWSTASEQALNRRLKINCKRGHMLSGENLYLWRNVRGCRLCRSVHGANAYKKRLGSL